MPRNCARRIPLDHARPAARDHARASPSAYESDQTTHFSIVDAAGNAVANTYTLNLPYGSGLVAEGTGVLLNNELDDFAAKPGAANAYRPASAATPTRPGPNKRPLSSMSPTMVFKDGELELVTGSPGGSRIITTVLQVMLDVVDHGLNVAEAEDAPRVHDQWLARRIAGRARPLARHDPAARGDGPQGRAARGDGLGQYDRAPRADLARGVRPAPARHAGGGLLRAGVVFDKLSREM